MDGQKEAKGKQTGRKSLALFMIFFPAAVAVGLGLMFGAIFHNGGFINSWKYWSLGMYVVFCGGGTMGGILTLILPEKIDDDFCRKAGYGLYYGTLAAAFILKKMFNQEFTVDIIGVSFGICALVCAVVWYKKKR